MRAAHLALLFLLFGFLGSAKAEQIVDDARISSLLVGKSATFADRSIATYETDGSYNYVAANNRYYRGKYTIAKGQVCLTMEKGGQNRCDKVGADTAGLYLIGTGGDILRFAVSPPIRLQNVKTICDVPMAYNIYPPSERVPASMAAFSGTWIGQWDYGMCGALIVESIQLNGMATVIYVNGEFGLGTPIKAGSMRFIGRIDDNTLTDGGKTVSFDVVMKGGTLFIRKTGGVGSGTAKFTRR
ncbi:MAG: hypothetical protein JSR90_00385 [Proteobacteria bacterium]|nr:hypothetical protein [Pseudomonadota bacterium]